MTKPESLRCAPMRMRSQRRRALGLLFVAALGSGLAATIASTPRPRIVWNASASVPIGLYWVEHEGSIDPGDMVIAWTPPAARDLASRRLYHPANVPLVKTVAGRAGDRVCAKGRRVFVNGRAVATRQASDSAGRALPSWHGCISLPPGALFLLAGHPGSFDGRYFGPVAAAHVVGEAHPLWTR